MTYKKEKIIEWFFPVNKSTVEIDVQGTEARLYRMFRLSPIYASNKNSDIVPFTQKFESLKWLGQVKISD